MFLDIFLSHKELKRAIHALMLSGNEDIAMKLQNAYNTELQRNTALEDEIETAEPETQHDGGPPVQREEHVHQENVQD